MDNWNEPIQGPQSRGSTPHLVSVQNEPTVHRERVDPGLQRGPPWQVARSRLRATCEVATCCASTVSSRDGTDRH